MSHRKYEAPRHGALRFLPRKRCRRHRGRIRHFPPDDVKKQPHLTAFIGYKAGMTHIMRELDRPGSKAHKKDVVEGVTIIETPPIIIVGLVGYVKTPTGMRSITTVWCSHVDDSFKRRFYKNWTKSKKKAFTQWQQKWASAKGGEDPAEVKKRLNYIKNYADVVRVIAHSQVKKLKNLGLKKAHVMEIQVNGGTIKQKVDFAYGLFEKAIDIKSVFHQNELIDTIGVSKGHGFKGVINRWGVKKLPRKTHRGCRKVACIGSWHPPRCPYTIHRAGQKGYHHRTELHKKIYRLGDSMQFDENGKPTLFNAKTDFDLTAKNITPLGAFPHYGIIRQDYIMIKGTCPGVRKRPITLRKPIYQPSSSFAREEVQLKFIDTSSQYGNGRFQTAEEKREWFGPSKKEKIRQKLQEKKRAGDDDNTTPKKKSKSSGSKKKEKASGSKKEKASGSKKEKESTNNKDNKTDNKTETAAKQESSKKGKKIKK